VKRCGQYASCIFHSLPKHLQITIARIGVDLGIFDAINENKEPLSVATLAQKTGAAPELLGMKNDYTSLENARAKHIKVVSYDTWLPMARSRRPARTTSAPAPLRMC